MVQKKIIYHRSMTPDFENAAEAFFSFKSASNAKILVMSLRIGLAAEVRDHNLAVRRRQYDQT